MTSNFLLASMQVFGPVFLAGGILMLVYGMCGTPQYKMKVWISEFNRLTEKEKDSEEDEEESDCDQDLENPASLHSTRF
ncbi:Oidioi.mRNA.OKI2018_I69.chr1.g2658.t1.cds [Oikopleura dioica]|uniref:Oidioi.mRNA.OKI2018_I69.chr1.g2658.t1.cds n=1 Tax=Oikopleura dioica TaxID=34765 RepID=A0ABN7SYN6_OIKDI|nr:Oidioi.mRNA.OKI2018_I69.chr1.g2658.t1.cds [Oikopleura dioica]